MGRIFADFRYIGIGMGHIKKVEMVVMVPFENLERHTANQNKGETPPIYIKSSIVRTCIIKLLLMSRCIKVTNTPK